MKNIISFETAKALKEAGFSQPGKIEQGQYWYDDQGYGTLWFREASLSNTPALAYQGFLFFAPSATDILEHLPEKALMFRGGNYFHVGIQNGHYKADEWGWVHLSKNTNPAEAAAIAWLELNEKK